MDTNASEIVQVRIETQMVRELAREEMNKMCKDWSEKTEEK